MTEFEKTICITANEDAQYKMASKPILEGYSITKGKRNFTFSITRNLEKTIKELFRREVKMKLFFAQ